MSDVQDSLTRALAGQFTIEREVGAGGVTADGKTVIYRQRRDVRRIAIADLSRVLTTKTAGR